MEGHLSTFTSLLDRQLTGYVMFSSAVLRPHFFSILSPSSCCSLLFSELKILSSLSLSRSTLLVSTSSLSYSNLTDQTTAIYNSDLYPQHAMHSTPPTICSTCLQYLPQLVQQKPANISITSLLSIADIRSLSLLFTYHPSALLTNNKHLFYPYLTVFHYSISCFMER